ncbi:putative nuclease HARBI1 [Topomyia yanbarensis]|uniref:putative nuclease HARBI1 n=1 Tax=Topomyia yanbarensis TaxID=2498891 RepID=UPI00273AA274|nr:putative nuclease HARBI1 [Topomyia yanbarensis]XP_058818658.1 putative nuclease HARBI1 [Topomyia yanbarensis]
MDCRKKACAAIIIALGSERRTARRYWMKEWLKKRENFSHVVLLKEISLKEKEDYRNYFRMNEETFMKLLSLVSPFITKQDTFMRRSLPANEKLALTLRYLATGRSFEDLKFSAIMSPASISAAIINTCEALIYVLQDYIKFPQTPQQWETISNDFGTLHRFWNCVGAIDGKHVAIRKPDDSGSQYYNYKGFYSIVLMAVANAKKEFLMIDVGMNGKISDGGVLFYTKFGELLREKSLNLPNPAPLPLTNEEFPFVFVGDEAFALDSNLMKPYSQKSLDCYRQVYNERLSTARVTIENVFGIITSRFGIFQKPINLNPEKAAKVTMAACYLHNYLAKENTNSYLCSTSNDESTCKPNLMSIRGTMSRNGTATAKNIRDRFCNYFNSNGKI